MLSIHSYSRPAWGQDFLVNSDVLIKELQISNHVTCWKQPLPLSSCTSSMRSNHHSPHPSRDIPGCPKLWQCLVPGPSSPKNTLGHLRISRDVPSSDNHLSQVQVVPSLSSPKNTLGHLGISRDVPGYSTWTWDKWLPELGTSQDILGCPKLWQSLAPGPSSPKKKYPRTSQEILWCPKLWQSLVPGPSSPKSK